MEYSHQTNSHYFMYSFGPKMRMYTKFKKCHLKSNIGFLHLGSIHTYNGNITFEYLQFLSENGLAYITTMTADGQTPFDYRKIMKKLKHA